MSMNVKSSGKDQGRHVVVVGAGAWGTTLSLLVERAGHCVTLVAHRRDVAEFIQNTGHHPTSLPGIAIPQTIRVVSESHPWPQQISAVVLAVPVQQIRTVVQTIANQLSGVPIISVAKGLEISTLLRPTMIIADMVGSNHPVAAMSGPNLALEIAEGRPATTLIASERVGLAEDMVGLFHSPRFRVYRGADVVGLEMGGALKNIIAIGAGIGEGLGTGDNAKAAFITRGLAEITRIGMACGAHPQTFAGISGMGDLIATCASPHSRNHRVGLALAKGMQLEDAISLVGEVAEGIPTTAAAHQLARQVGVDAPIVEQMHRVLFEGVPVDRAIELLMGREPTGEVRDDR